LLPYANLTEALEAAPADRRFITAWIDEDDQETVTFAEFLRRARNEAMGFARNGIAEGDRVVLIMPQSINAMTAFVGAMMLGAVPAFLAYPNFKVEASKYSSGLSGVTANLSAKAIVIDNHFPPDMLGYVSLNSETKLLRSPVESLLATSLTAQESNDLARSVARINPQSLAFIQHSAGTTGLQKGVALTHAAVLRQLEHLAVTLKIDAASDRVYSWLPLYHDMGLIAAFMLPMVCHIPVVMQSPLDWVMQPESMLQVVSEQKCTLAWMPNFAFQFVPRRTPQSRWRDYDLSSLRALINCSEPVRASSMSEFQGAFRISDGVLHTSYAMAENVFAVTQSHLDGGPATIWADGHQFRTAHRTVTVPHASSGSISFTSSGRVLPSQRLKILSQSGEPLADASVGEIVIHGDCLFEGYYNRSDLTRQSLIGGWYHTGDLGFVLDGELYVVGRKKDLLIIGGENIYPQDIEELVSAHPAIHDGRVVAIGVYNPNLGTEDVVVAAEVEREESLTDAARLEQEIRSRIVAGLGIAVRTILLKPPMWIVKSTAGKPARSATRDKLLREHPELSITAGETTTA
jgi:acyl-CoA synthetase (AMP-forming)/AMP-acid ligase II